jgi:hypothetical protein
MRARDARAPSSRGPCPGTRGSGSRTCARRPRPRRPQRPWQRRRGSVQTCRPAACGEAGGLSCGGRAASEARRCCGWARSAAHPVIRERLEAFTASAGPCEMSRRASGAQPRASRAAAGAPSPPSDEGSAHLLLLLRADGDEPPHGCGACGGAAGSERAAAGGAAVAGRAGLHARTIQRAHNAGGAGLLEAEPLGRGDTLGQHCDCRGRWWPGVACGGAVWCVGVMAGRGPSSFGTGAAGRGAEGLAAPVKRGASDACSARSEPVFFSGPGRERGGGGTNTSSVTPRTAAPPAARPRLPSSHSSSSNGRDGGRRRRADVRAAGGCCALPRTIAARPPPSPAPLPHPSSTFLLLQTDGDDHVYPYSRSYGRTSIVTILGGADGGRSMVRRASLARGSRHRQQGLPRPNRAADRWLQGVATRQAARLHQPALPAPTPPPRLPRLQAGKSLKVGGWVKTGREAGAGAFAFLEVNDGSCFESLQVRGPCACLPPCRRTLLQLAARPRGWEQAAAPHRMHACPAAARRPRVPLPDGPACPRHADHDHQGGGGGGRRAQEAGGHRHQRAHPGRRVGHARGH